MLASLARSALQPALGVHTSRGYTAVLAAGRISENVTKAEYAVRGFIPQRAEALKRALAALPTGPTGAAQYAFGEVVQCNIGNPQELGQAPLTFPRQVMSLALYPPAMRSPSLGWDSALLENVYPKDVIDRVRGFYEEGGVRSFGAYSGSQGIAAIRERVAAFIQHRDRAERAPDPNDIFLINGASTGIAQILSLVIQNPNSAIMIPIPQYPLYSATIQLLGGTAVPYYLDEASGWSTDLSSLESAVQQAKKDGKDVKAIVVINPGNPTGSCLSTDHVKSIIEFAHTHSLLLLADEVYQENVYGERPFTSFKKALTSLSASVASTQELVSFHSTSKGFFGECGLRGGYMELCNIGSEGHAEILKLASVSLCPNLVGQIATDCMVSPPKETDPSYPLYASERRAILSSLKRRADLLVQTLRGLDGVTCQNADGAMYLFPQIMLPPAAIEEAAAKGLSPDAFYCLSLLESTGVCTVPGSGFGQVPGTFHLRITFLPREDTFPGFAARIVKFHTDFMKQYAA